MIGTFLFTTYVKKSNIRSICHEHIAYYTLSTFKKIANKNGLKILDYKFNEINGGSIEIFCSRIDSNRKIKEKKIKKLLTEEKRINLQAFVNFNRRIQKVKLLFQMFLKLNSKKKLLVMVHLQKVMWS